MNTRNNTDKTERKVFEYMKKNRLLEAEDKVVLGVSGGADSLCLFELLLEYRKQVDFQMAVVHVNHGIRKDAAEDAEFVEQICSQNNISFHLVEVNVREVAQKEKCSEEDAGRRIRYQAFAELSKELGGAKIAVAHNANDCAETVLLHLFRGSGLRGLRGIEAVRGNIIRPLLCLERKEIEEYLSGKKVIWCNDSTNDEDDYTRNRLRHNVLPYVEKEIAENSVAHICKTAEMISETEEYLRQQTQAAATTCIGEEGIDVDAFLRIPKVLQKRILLDLLEKLSSTGKDIEWVHVESVLGLFERDGNRSVELPKGIIAKRSYGKVRLYLPDREEDEEEKEFEFTVFPYDSKAEIPQNLYTKWFDYDKINSYAVGGKPVVRFRKEGDYLTLSDGKGNRIHKSLKNYMVSAKIPKDKRDRIPVIADGSHIIWLVGYRISEHYKVTKDTRRILQITNVTDKKNNG